MFRDFAFTGLQDGIVFFQGQFFAEVDNVKTLAA